MVENAVFNAGLAALETAGTISISSYTSLAASAALTGGIAGGVTGGFVGGFVGSGGNLSAALQGAAVGGLSGFIGASGGALAGRTAKAVAHGVVGGAQAAVNGGKFLRGFASSFFTKQVSGRISGTFKGNKVGGAIAAATVGGTTAVIGGGKFANGAYTTAFQYLFNERGQGADDFGTPYPEGCDCVLTSVGGGKRAWIPRTQVADVILTQETGASSISSYTNTTTTSSEVATALSIGSLATGVGSLSFGSAYLAKLSFRFAGLALLSDPTIPNAVGVMGGSATKYIITPRFGSNAGEFSDVVNTGVSALILSNDFIEK